MKTHAQSFAYTESAVRAPALRAAGRAGRLLCLLLLAFSLSACDVALYSGMTEQDANEIVMVLMNGGIRASKVSGDKGTWNVTVDEALFSRSLDLLAANGLPRSRYQSMGDVFRKDSMVSTPVEEQARLVYALSQELSGTIAQIDGVLAARVHLVLPEIDSFGNKISPSTASVFIKHKAEVDLAPQLNQIRRLVENSVRDLKMEAVSVFLFPSTLPTPMPVPPQSTVFGISVPPGQEGLIRFAIIAVLVVVLGAAAYLVFSRMKRKERAAAEE